MKGLLSARPHPSRLRTILLAAVVSGTILYALYASPLWLSLSDRFARLTNPRHQGTCSPRAYANGSWTPKPHPPRVPGRAPDDIAMHQQEDALAFAGFEGCASSREFWWHLAADKPQLWDRFPAVTSWDWTPSDDCKMRPLDGAAIVKDMVENGGWLLIGGELTLQPSAFQTQQGAARAFPHRTPLHPCIVRGRMGFVPLLLQRA